MATPGLRYAGYPHPYPHLARPLTLTLPLTIALPLTLPLPLALPLNLTLALTPPSH